MDRRYRYSKETIAVFAALAIFLSTIEYMIPKPLPFLRLGLANLPIIISIAIFSPYDILLLSLLKILGQGFVNGTLLSYIFLFSAAGTFTSTLVMILIYRFSQWGISLIGVSIAGALASNIVQLWLSGLFVFGASVKFIAPPFLATGLVTSLVLGIFASEFVVRSNWLKSRELGKLSGAVN